MNTPTNEIGLAIWIKARIAALEARKETAELEEKIRLGFKARGYKEVLDYLDKHVTNGLMPYQKEILASVGEEIRVCKDRGRVPRFSAFPFRAHSPDGPIIPSHIKDPETGRMLVNPEWETAEWEAPIELLYHAKVFEKLIPTTKATDL